MKCPSARKVSKPSKRWLFFEVSHLCSDVGIVQHSLRYRDACKRMFRTNVKRRFAPPRLSECFRCIVHRCDRESVAFGEIKYAEIRLANTRGISQDGLQYRIEVAERTRYDVEHLRSGRLLFQRLVQFAGKP